MLKSYNFCILRYIYIFCTYSEKIVKAPGNDRIIYPKFWNVGVVDNNGIWTQGEVLMLMALGLLQTTKPLLVVAVEVHFRYISFDLICTQYLEFYVLAARERESS